MADERLLVPIDEPYLHAVGLAAICFARLEWDAVWCCEKLQPGYIPTIKAERKTAGRIAQDLIDLAARHPDETVNASLSEAASEFKRLTGRRNDLLHANLATSPEDEQRLVRDGLWWSIKDINEAADEFVRAARPLNHHLHRVL